ncbi:MAG: hypothetical protein CMP23_01580 [Rickettsiales bacterium]|nr:hypothetical protein [Rickettsiales bacterium]|tara:strand:- start:6513 stop:8231 length:1719 start_codon:yes stop_codon:yes gene_type:complete
MAWMLALMGSLAALFPGSLEARGAAAVRADRAADRELAEARQQRDRGQLEQAMSTVLALLKERPEDFAVHRFYMELAATSRRNGGLVEAEYRHFLEQEGGGSFASLLHGAATLTAELTFRGPLREQRVRQIERRLAAAEADPKTAVWAHLVAIDLAKLQRSLPRIKQALNAAVELDSSHPSVRVEQLQLLVLEEQLDAAADICLKLLQDSPWRADACGAVMRSSERRLLPSDALQERLQNVLKELERRFKRDKVVLQSLVELYRDIDDRKGTRRLEASLRALHKDWQPPLRRNPYMTPLRGGELSDEELDALQSLRALSEGNDEDPWALVKALQALDGEMNGSPRIRAMYLRQKAYALRAKEVLDRDGSRAAVREAMELLPDDPHIINEWAYMSALDKVDLAQALEAIDKALLMLLGENFALLELDPGESFDEWEGDRSESVGAFIDTRGWVLYQLGRHEEAARDLELASLLTSDGTVQGHLGRARYAVGNDDGAFHNLLRALALGTEDQQQVRDLAEHLYQKQHAVPGGLQVLVDETRRQLGIVVDMDGGPESGTLQRPEGASLRPGERSE